MCVTALHAHGVGVRIGAGAGVGIGVGVRCGPVTVNGKRFCPKDLRKALAPWSVGPVLDDVLKRGLWLCILWPKGYAKRRFGSVFTSQGAVLGRKQVRSRSALHTHVLVCICINVRQFIDPKSVPLAVCTVSRRLITCVALLCQPRLLVCIATTGEASYCLL